MKCRRASDYKHCLTAPANRRMLVGGHLIVPDNTRLDKERTHAMNKRAASRTQKAGK